jgi:hypothetical protein
MQPATVPTFVILKTWRTSARAERLLELGRGSSPSIAERMSSTAL